MSDQQTISYIISYPTEDAKNSVPDRFHLTGVVTCLEDIGDKFLVGIPSHILTMVASAFSQRGEYRVELVEGLTSYKFYRRPDRNVWPKHTTDNALELFQQQKADEDDDGAIGLADAVGQIRLREVNEQGCPGTRQCKYTDRKGKFCVYCPVGN